MCVGECATVYSQSRYIFLVHSTLSIMADGYNTTQRAIPRPPHQRIFPKKQNSRPISFQNFSEGACTSSSHFFSGIKDDTYLGERLSVFRPSEQGSPRFRGTMSSPGFHARMSMSGKIATYSSVLACLFGCAPALLCLKEHFGCSRQPR